MIVKMIMKKVIKKILKKYATAKYSKKTNSTKLVAKNNKKVAGSVYAVKLVDDKKNTIILNIERDEINKAVKKTTLTKADSERKSVTAQDIISKKDGDQLKTVRLSLAGFDESKKSAFNNNAITWKVGAGKNATILKVGQVTKITSKKGDVAYVTLTEDAEVKVLSGNNKGIVKLSAEVDKKVFKTMIKVK